MLSASRSLRRGADLGRPLQPLDQDPPRLRFVAAPERGGGGIERRDGVAVALGEQRLQLHHEEQAEEDDEAPRLRR